VAYLLDTNIIIYSLKKNRNVQANFLTNAKIPKYISIITYGELLHGAKKSQQIEKNCEKVYRIRSLFPVIEINIPVIEVFSDIKAKYERIGIVVDDLDLLIASTALVYNHVLVTNNTKHFEKIRELSSDNWA
jgi:tRNA(fMet)-specific endonuclease VapC